MSGRPGFPKPWLPHAICLGLLVLQVATWAALHRADARIERAWREGTTAQRLDAFHVMMNRGSLQDRGVDARFVNELLEEGHERIRETAFTNEVCKFSGPERQNRYVDDFDISNLAHAWRSYVIHRRKVGNTTVVGGGRRLRLQELEWFLDATHGRPLSVDAIRRHIEEIISEIYRRMAS